MPFAVARPLSHAGIDIRHTALRIAWLLYAVVNTCFIIFHLTGNVFSNLFLISVDTSSFSSASNENVNESCCSQQNLGRKRLNQ